MKLRSMVLTGLVSGLMGSAAASAAPDVTLSLSSSTPASGVLDVFAAEPSGTDQLSQYQISVQVTPEAGASGAITLTAGNGTVPLFSDASGGYLPVNSPLYYVTSDDSNNFPATVTLGSTPLNLFNLAYSASPGSQGVFDVKFFTTPNDPLTSQLYDSSFNPIAGTTFANGTITITAPEPASAILGGGIGVVGLLFRRRSRRTA